MAPIIDYTPVWGQRHSRKATPMEPIPADRVVFEETLRGGQMWSRVVRRDQALRIIDVEGGATPGALFYNAAQPLERYNMPDTLKAQHVSRLTEGLVLYSDMGHVLMSIIRDTAGWHDTITGHMDARASAGLFGPGTYQELRNDYHRNTRDNFLIELGKHGLGARDLGPNVNFFLKVVVGESGDLRVIEQHKPGQYVDLRAEMDVLVVLSNTPHPLSPLTRYPTHPVHLVLWQPSEAKSDDPCRTSCSENQRGFALTENYYR